MTGAAPNFPAGKTPEAGTTLHGACLCRAVIFRVAAPVRPVVACHCTQCRKASGHFWAAAAVPTDGVRLIRDDGLAWFRSSAAARRGFCKQCGATLFWRADAEDQTSFSPGALEGPCGLAVARQVFTADAGDYYAPVGPPPAPSAAPRLLDAACLCRGVRFRLPRPKGGITACHCTQCRKLSGHYTASFDVDEAQVRYATQAGLAEYATATGARRGFCAGCGSSLYFRAADGTFSVEAGVIDGPTGSTLTSHIFVADKGDYYALDDGLPQHPGAE